MYLAPPTQIKITSIIKGLKKNGPGYDNFSIQDVQNAGPVFVNIFFNVIKNSIIHSRYPQCLKTALIRPIKKSSSHSKFKIIGPFQF